MKRVLACWLAAVLWSAAASAQEFPRWDVSGEVGWLSSNQSDIGPEWNEWYDEPVGGALLGRYVGPHLKTELRFAFGGEARIYEQEPIVVPGQPFPIFRSREHILRKTSLGGSVHYQIFENQWFHPQLGAGLEIARETDRTLAPELRVSSRDPGRPLIVPPLAETRRVDWTARPFVTGGFKWYVNDRGFIRSDLRVAFGDEVADVTWSAGIGVDL